MMGVIGGGGRRPAIIGLEEARFFETGDPSLDAIYMEYVDFLSLPGADPSLRGAMIAEIASRFCGADTIVFRNLRPEMSAAVRGFAEGGPWASRTLLEQPVYAIDLAAIRERGGDFIESLESASLRNKVRRAIRGYEERGNLTCRIASNEDRLDAWRRLGELHEARWRGVGAFSNRLFLDFHEKLQRLAPDACELMEITCGDEAIGVLYNFSYEGRVMNYQSGFRAEDDNRLTPGFVCHALACQHYLEHGAGVYDLLAGEADYKRRFGAPAVTLTSIALERSSWRIAIRNALKGSGPRAAQEGVEHDDAP